MPLTTLPLDILLCILDHLPRSDRQSLRHTCSPTYTLLPDYTPRLSSDPKPVGRHIFYTRIRYSSAATVEPRDPERVSFLERYLSDLSKARKRRRMVCGRCMLIVDSDAVDGRNWAKGRVCLRCAYPRWR